MKIDISLINPGLQNVKPYDAGKSVKEAERSLGDQAFQKMASNENPLGISPKAEQAAIRSVKASFQYPDVTGFDLRNSLAKKFDVAPEMLILGNGADGLLYTTAMTLLGQDDEVIIPAVTFSLFETIVKAMHTRVVLSDMDGPSIDLKDMFKRITPKTKLIYICNPNNPTGTLIPAAEVSSFLFSLPENVFAIYDEVYFDFTLPELLPDTLKLIREGKKNLINIRSFSKVYGLAGLRVGYGIAAEELINLMYRIRPPFDVSVVAQAAAIGALEDENFYNKTLELARQEKEFLYRSFTELEIDYIPSYTNFILFDAGKNCSTVSRGLLERGIIIRSGFAGPFSTWIRITPGIRDQNERFIKALKEILK